MTPTRPVGDGGTGAASDASRLAWSLMCDLVLNNERRREVSDGLGMSFGRIKAIRRLARAPMALWELASTLGVDAPYATVIVDDLEAQGLVRRRPHPSDGRAKLVEVTRKGRDVARRADKILSTPPPALASLDPEQVGVLVRVLHAVSEAAHD
ncbi:MAG TPA: MarR family transcriptional regulator [Acidimicrobiales bacterium]|nr:MarR family transcriptional regulator [Acidimicrobiales bacterium]